MARATGACTRSPAARDGALLCRGQVLGVLSASIGSIQVTGAIKRLTSIGELLLGRLVVNDALDM